MRLGYVSLPAPGAADRLLSAIAADLAAGGLQLAGAVQHSLETGSGSARPEMWLRVLGTAEALAISQRLGTGARGCTLDADGLERAVALAAGGLAGADLLIVNKFGKQESLGRGFRPLIAEALMAGIPVLTAVRPDYLPAFRDFAGGMETALPAEAVRDWALGLRGAA